MSSYHIALLLNVMVSCICSSSINLPALVGSEVTLCCLTESPAAGGRAEVEAAVTAAGAASKCAGPQRLAPPAPLRVSWGSPPPVEGVAADFAAGAGPASPCMPVATQPGMMQQAKQPILWLRAFHRCSSRTTIAHTKRPVHHFYLGICRVFQGFLPLTGLLDLEEDC